MLRQLQIEQAEWSIRNELKQTSELMLLGVMEELGELSHSHLKDIQGIRSNENHRANKIDAIGDIVTYLAAYCNSEHIDLQEAVETTWNKVKQRNWIKNKTTGE
jgi:NTP pyrophosphatase (non-canonical NTP hydrolase)